jgi:hypothetical protein
MRNYLCRSVYKAFQLRHSQNTGSKNFLKAMCCRIIQRKIKIDGIDTYFIGLINKHIQESKIQKA